MGTCGWSVHILVGQEAERAQLKAGLKDSLPGAHFQTLQSPEMAPPARDQEPMKDISDSKCNNCVAGLCIYYTVLFNGYFRVCLCVC